MKTKITYKDLMARGACYDPRKIGMPTNYSATIPEFIKEYRDKVKEKEDIVWAVCHDDYMTDKDMRLFAVWCAREALKLIESPDPRSIHACDIAEQFANGETTREELDAAWAAARDAVGDAARAAWDAAEAARAAWAAEAAGDAARAAAWAAAWDARDAAGAARDAAGAARDAAGAARVARDARVKQSRRLYRMIMEGRW